MGIDTAKTMQWGALIDPFSGILVETLDAIDGSDYEISFVSGFSGKEAQTRRWLVRDYDWLTACVTHWALHRLRCVLSREGDVRLYGPGGTPDRIYVIPDAGVKRKDAAGYGYVNRIRAVDDALYVCGQSRQVYRFAPAAARVLDGQWVDHAGSMRQPPMAEPPDDADDEEALNRWLDDNNAVDFEDIAGSSAHDLYACGDECWHYDGRQWRQLALPSDEPIHAIKVLDVDHVVMVGHNGTLLMGNASSGFCELSSAEDNQNFTGIEWFDDKLFLASNLGLFVYEPAQARIRPYATTLKPELQDTHLLEAKDGILWSFGFKDLAYFDGKAWTRVDHPDNPPIG